MGSAGITVNCFKASCRRLRSLERIFQKHLLLKIADFKSIFYAGLNKFVTLIIAVYACITCMACRQFVFKNFSVFQYLNFYFLLPFVVHFSSFLPQYFCHCIVPALCVRVEYAAFCVFVCVRVCVFV